MASNDVSLYSDESICQQIRICLMRIKRDDAFVNGELASEDYDTIKEGKDATMRNKFIDYVFKSLFKKKSKLMSPFKERLMLNNLLETAITTFDAESYTMEDDPIPIDDVQRLIEGKSSIVQNGNNTEADGSSSNKRRRSSSSKKGKASKKNRISFQMSASERQRLADETKLEYLSLKGDVLSRVPESHKKHWGQIMFCKWKKDPPRPVLVIGPYQVHPTLRETWMKMFENTKGDPQRMWYWTYWYGSPENEAFTQQKPNTLIPFEKAVATKIHVPPATLQAKLDSGKKLKGTEEQTMKGYASLDKELKKKPAERIPIPFREDFETILDLDDEVSLPGDDEDQGEHGSDNDESDSDVVDKVVIEKMVPVVKKKKKIKVKTHSEKEDSKAAAEQNQPIMPMPMEIDDEIGEAEVSEGDNHDADFEKSIETDDDNEDLNYDEDPKVGKVKKKSSKVKKGSIPENLSKPKKARKLSVGADVKPNKVSKKLGKRATTPIVDELNPEKQELLEKRRNADRVRKQEKKAVDDYRTCVKRYGHIAEELAIAVEKKDLAIVVERMEKLKEGVRELNAPFIEDYKLAQSMKAAKAILTSEGDQRVRKELWNEMKEVYSEAKNKTPQGWRNRLVNSDVMKVEYIDAPGKIRESKESREGKHRNVNGKEETENTMTDLSARRISLERESSGSIKSRPSFGGDIETLHEPNNVGFKPTKAEVSDNAKSELPNVALVVKAIKKKSKLSSYMSLMNTDKRKEVTDTLKNRNSAGPDQIVCIKKIPEWLTKDYETDPLVEFDEDRSLAMEFFEEAAECFHDTINRAGFARALEGATFAWASSNSASSADVNAWKMMYWERVHIVAGALAGKQNTGTLVSAIMDGKYESAEAIIRVPDNVLFSSFNGQALNGAG